jgi:hypothetical protein
VMEIVCGEAAVMDHVDTLNSRQSLALSARGRARRSRRACPRVLAGSGQRNSFSS